MVAGGEHVRAKVKKLFGNLRRHAKPAGSIFGVDDGQFHIMCLTHVPDVLADNPAPGTSKNVANEKDVQAFSDS